MLVSSSIKQFDFRKLSISALLLGFTLYAFASIGGDKNKSRKNSIQSGFAPLTTSRGINLRDGFNYHGSLTLRREKTSEFVSYNSIVTYQKGNATYIISNKYKISLKPENIAGKSNLQLLQLKIKLCK